MHEIGEAIFKDAYHLALPSFKTLLKKIQDQLEVSNQQAINFRGSSICAATCLAMTLCFLSGESYIDICFTHGVAFPTFYKRVWSTLEAINDV